MFESRGRAGLPTRVIVPAPNVVRSEVRSANPRTKSSRLYSARNGRIGRQRTAVSGCGNFQRIPEYRRRIRAVEPPVQERLGQQLDPIAGSARMGDAWVRGGSRVIDSSPRIRPSPCPVV